MAVPARVLDAAPDAPLHPVARQALEASLAQGWADPDRLHAAGRRARLLADGAREAVASVLACRPDEVHLVAGGALASAVAVGGAAAARARTSTRVLVSAVEHSAVLDAAARHDAVVVPVDRLGRVDPAAYGRELADGAALACLQSANGEVGTVQPVAAVAAHCQQAGVPLLVDASASLGHAPVPAGWSLLTASAPGWGGPPGVGVLAVRTGTRLRPPLPLDLLGAGLPWALAAALSLQAAAAEAEQVDARLRPLVARLAQELPRRVPGLDVAGDPDGRLPHLLSVSCLYVDGESLVRALDVRGLALASGSACTSARLEPSHVLAAMGALTGGNLRIALHRDSTADDVQQLLAVLPQVVADLRRAAGAQDLL